MWSWLLSPGVVISRCCSCCCTAIIVFAVCCCYRQSHEVSVVDLRCCGRTIPQIHMGAHTHTHLRIHIDVRENHIHMWWLFCVFKKDENTTTKLNAMTSRDMRGDANVVWGCCWRRRNCCCYRQLQERCACAVVAMRTGFAIFHLFAFAHIMLLLLLSPFSCAVNCLCLVKMKIVVGSTVFLLLLLLFVFFFFLPYNGRNFFSILICIVFGHYPIVLMNFVFDFLFFKIIIYKFIFYLQFLITPCQQYMYYKNIWYLFYWN